MAKKTFSLQTSDHLRLHGLHWPVDAPQAVLCLVHGLGEHIARYGHLAEYFNKKDIAVMGFDRRGHGESGGLRGHTPSYDALLDEIVLLEEEAAKCYPGIPQILYGHSQGGNLVLSYELNRKPRSVAVISSAPWIQLSFEPPALLVGLGKMMNQLYPAFSNKNSLNISHLCTDGTVVNAYAQDPLVHDKITAGMGIAMMQSANKLDAFQEEVPLPTLLMHGSEDKITSMPASRAFAHRVRGDVSVKVWEGLYHEIHNEVRQEEVFDHAYEWLTKYI